MKLNKETITDYEAQNSHLYEHELGESIKGLIFFALFAADGELLAVSSLKNYMGYWYLRGCVVPEELRGDGPEYGYPDGFQQQLICEREEWVRTKTDTLRVSVDPKNLHSLRNIEAAGYSFEKKKKLKDGSIVDVYKKSLATLETEG